MISLSARDITDPMTKVLKILFTSLVKLYQLAISPLIGPRCRFTPTCSRYAIEAAERLPLAVALKLTVKRIFKCHPYKSLGGSDGIDLVPIIKETKVNKNG